MSKATVQASSGSGKHCASTWKVAETALKRSRSGNKLTDAGREAQLEIANELIQGIATDVENGIDILPVYNQYKKFKKMLAENENIGGGDMWADLSTIKGLDREFMIHWLMGKSDMSFQDLLEIDEVDPHALNLLVRYASQLGAKLLLPPELKQKAMMAKFLDLRDEMCGNRLSKFKTNGGISTATKKLDMDKLFDFTVSFDEHGLATTITQISSRANVLVPPESGLKKGVKIEVAYDDCAAHFVRPPKSKVKIADFFEKPAGEDPIGPFCLNRYVGKSFKDLEKFVKAMVAEHKGKLAEISQSSNLEPQQLAKLTEATKKRDSEKMHAAREAAQKRMKEARASEAVELAKTPK